LQNYKKTNQTGKYTWDRTNSPIIIAFARG